MIPTLQIGQFGRGDGSQKVAGALDPYTASLWFAGGIRRVLSAYPQASPLIRVRRSSDNAEMDVLANGHADPTLNTTSITSWSGSDSVFVVRVYSQLNDGNNFAAASNATQPRLYDAGVYDGFLRFDGTDDVQTSANLIPTCSGLSFALCAANRAASNGVWAFTSSVFAGKGAMWNRNGAVDRSEVYVTQSGSAYDTWITNTYSPVSSTMAGRCLAVGLNLAGVFRYHQNGGAGVGVNSSFATGGGGGSGDYTAQTVKWGDAAAQQSSRAFAFWTRTLSEAEAQGVSGALNF